MSIQASCGHILSDADGPDGMGWAFATKDYSPEGLPAVTYSTFCTGCKTAALSEPDFVLPDTAAQDAWLMSGDLAEAARSSKASTRSALDVEAAQD